MSAPSSSRHQRARPTRRSQLPLAPVVVSVHESAAASPGGHSRSAAGHRIRTAERRRGAPCQPDRPTPYGHGRLPRHRRFRRLRAARTRIGPAGRSRPGPARRARPGQDPADADPDDTARRVDPRRSPAARSTTSRTSRSASGAAPSPLELGDDLPVSWRHRDDRYTEKLATPDTSVGDLIGDVDPVKVAQGRTLGDPETVHYGLVPRANRGLFGAQRAARPGRTDPGGPVQRAGGAGHPGPRVFAAAAAGRVPDRHRQPRGLHQSRPDHHPAEGPVRRRDPNPLPDRAARRGGPAAPGGASWWPRWATTCSRCWPGSPGACGSRPSVDQRSGVSARFTIAAAEAVAGPPCAGPPAPGTARRWPGSAICRRSCRRCSARSSSRWGRRAGSARCSITCCGWRPRRPSATGSVAWTCPASPVCSARVR